MADLLAMRSTLDARGVRLRSFVDGKRDKASQPHAEQGNRECSADA